MGLDMFRSEILLILTKGDKQAVRKIKLDLEKRTGLETQIYLGSIRLRMILKAREQIRCSKEEHGDRGENSLRTKPCDILRGGRATKEAKKTWL